MPTLRFYNHSATIVLCLSTWAAADERWVAPIKQVTYSSSGEYYFCASPGALLPERYGDCLGVLYRVNQNTRTLVWSRHLVNNIAPVRIHVADSGKYVVTMDEWYHTGVFPVVIYGERGKLIEVHDRDSLKLKDDAVLARDTSLVKTWDEGAVVFFGPEEETLFIRLRWGRMLMIRLRDGQLMDREWLGRRHLVGRRAEEWKSLRDFGQRTVQQLALKLLRSEIPRDRWTGALVAKDHRLRKAIPDLKGLLSDQSAYRTRARTAYYVREAARAALDAMENAPSTQPSAGVASQDSHPS